MVQIHSPRPTPLPSDAVGRSFPRVVCGTRFQATGKSNTSPVTKNFVVPAGKVAAVTDVLDALLSLPVGSTGALRFRSDWPVAVLCRTSNVDPSGVKPGTFGFQQVPVPLLSCLTSADAEPR